MRETEYHAITDSVAHHHTELAIRHLQVLDSIYLHDSIYIRERADTVFWEKYRTEYKFRDRTLHDTLRLTDTLYLSHTDTLRLTETHIKTQKEIPKFFKVCTALFWFAILLIILYIILRIYLRR